MGSTRATIAGIVEARDISIKAGKAPAFRRKLYRLVTAERLAAVDRAWRAYAEVMHLGLTRDEMIASPEWAAIRRAIMGDHA